MSRPTDHRNLDLCDLNLDVAFGRAGGKVIWQPRILAWFTDRYFTKTPLPPRYEGRSEPDIYRDLGCSNRLYFFNDSFQNVDPPGVVRRDVQPDDTHITRVIETPAGTVTEEVRVTPNSWYRIEEKRWIETPEDMRVFTWLMDHTDWRWDQPTYERVLAEWGRLGAPTMYMPRVNVQDLYINTMGVERGVWALYEWGGVVDDYFRALHGNHMRMIDVINASPIQLINFGDNLHNATLSPKLYEEYVLPAYLERCDKLHQAGKWVCSHWDGETKAILKYARTSGLDGIEAITPKPQGDVTLEEAKEALGDDIFLLAGIPAIYLDATLTDDDLAVSDEMSSQGDIERIRLVGRIVDDYNAHVSSKT